MCTFGIPIELGLILYGFVKNLHCFPVVFKAFEKISKRWRHFLSKNRRIFKKL
jgi:hypothetical protein